MSPLQKRPHDLITSPEAEEAIILRPRLESPVPTPAAQAPLSLEAPPATTTTTRNTAIMPPPVAAPLPSAVTRTLRPRLSLAERLRNLDPIRRREEAAQRVEDAVSTAPAEGGTIDYNNATPTATEVEPIPVAQTGQKIQDSVAPAEAGRENSASKEPTAIDHSTPASQSQTDPTATTSSAERVDSPEPEFLETAASEASLESSELSYAPSSSGSDGTGAWEEQQVRQRPAITEDSTIPAEVSALPKLAPRRVEKQSEAGPIFFNEPARQSRTLSSSLASRNQAPGALYRSNTAMSNIYAHMPSGYQAPGFQNPTPPRPQQPQAASMRFGGNMAPGPLSTPARMSSAPEMSQARTSNVSSRGSHNTMASFPANPTSFISNPYQTPPSSVNNCISTNTNMFINNANATPTRPSTQPASNNAFETKPNTMASSGTYNDPETRPNMMPGPRTFNALDDNFWLITKRPNLSAAILSSALIRAHAQWSTDQRTISHLNHTTNELKYANRKETLNHDQSIARLRHQLAMKPEDNTINQENVALKMRVADLEVQAAEEKRKYQEMRDSFIALNYVTFEAVGHAFGVVGGRGGVVEQEVGRRFEIGLGFVKGCLSEEEREREVEAGLAGIPVKWDRVSGV